MIQKETVLKALKELRLDRCAEILEAELDEAQREGRDGLELVGRLAFAQTGANAERRIQRRIREARFPDLKTLDTFDWAFQPSLERHRVLELARLEFVGKQQNVLLGGNSGTGKSHIAKALGVLACGAGMRTRFTTCEDMFRDLFAAQCDHTLPIRLKTYTLPQLLIIDDLGFERIEIKEAGNAHLLLKVINARYEKSSTIITSNIALDLWGTYLGDATIAMATLDRFVHHAALFHIDGPSWREHQSRLLPFNAPRHENSDAAPKRTQRRSKKDD
jgi:DNA replication protein DnaC